MSHQVEVERKDGHYSNCTNEGERTTTGKHEYYPGNYTQKVSQLSILFRVRLTLTQNNSTVCDWALKPFNHRHLKSSVRHYATWPVQYCTRNHLGQAYQKLFCSWNWLASDRLALEIFSLPILQHCWCRFCARTKTKMKTFSNIELCTWTCTYHAHSRLQTIFLEMILGLPQDMLTERNNWGLWMCEPTVQTA